MNHGDAIDLEDWSGLKTEVHRRVRSSDWVLKGKALGGEEGSISSGLDDRRVMMCRTMLERLGDQMLLAGASKQMTGRDLCPFRSHVNWDRADEPWKGPELSPS